METERHGEPCLASGSKAPVTPRSKLRSLPRLTFADDRPVSSWKSVRRTLQMLGDWVSDWRADNRLQQFCNRIAGIEEAERPAAVIDELLRAIDAEVAVDGLDEIGRLKRALVRMLTQ